MSNSAIFRKISRIAAIAAVGGTTAALLLIGAPADAATVPTGAEAWISSVARVVAGGAARGI